VSDDTGSLPELRREDLLTEPNELAEVVATWGRGDGVGLQEAFLRCCFKPEALSESLRFYTHIIPVIEGEHRKTAFLMRVRVEHMMAEALDTELSTSLRMRVTSGMVAVIATPPTGGNPVEMDAAAVMRGNINIMGETISDYRTGHLNLYDGIRLVPTAKATRMFPEFNHAAAFTEALDTLGCWEEGGRGPDGKPVRRITATKRELHDHLQREHPGRFGNLGTFTTNYAPKGDRAKGLDYSILWMNNLAIKPD
jgi:hypothetical protein